MESPKVEINTISYKHSYFTLSHAYIVLKWEASENFNSSKKWNIIFKANIDTYLFI